VITLGGVEVVQVIGTATVEATIGGTVDVAGTVDVGAVSGTVTVAGSVDVGSVGGTVDVAGTVDIANEIEVASNLVSFGGLHTVALHPRVQLDAVYGVLTTDHQALTALSGGAVATNGLFVCTTGTSAGGYGVIRSTRLVRYRAGQGVRLMCTAMFTTGVASSLQLAGGFSATEALCFGYQGTEFGVLRRQPGAVAIHRLTVTVGSGGVETITVKLNGVDFSFSSGGALATDALARLIAAQTSYTGWTATQPQAVGSTVTFLQDVPAATVGAFTLTSTGTAAGTFATIQAGAANVTTGSNVWISKASWNLDPCDGNGPSGFNLDPTKLNIYAVTLPYLGAGDITYAVKLPNGRMWPVHRIQYPNSATAPNLRNPTLRLGWIAASLGSTTALTVSGASAAGFREGDSQLSLRGPRSRARTVITATTTKTTVLLLRNRSEMGGTVCLREISPTTLRASNESSTRNVIVQCFQDPVLSGTPAWTRVASESSVDYSESALQISSGEPFESATIAGLGSVDMEIHEYDIRIAPGSIIAVTVETTASTASVDCTLSWLEI
jgi:hypothetical protein